MAKKLRICETVLRDGHQSILATRMRYEQMEPVLGLLDEIGYEALECWGGATYDSCLRFLNEDPWERLRKLKANVKNTPLQMLLRGQNLLGYKHYSDDVVEAFCNAAVKNGIDRIRIFDALNDPRNMEAAIKYSKKAGAHVQSAMVYTISPVHTTESFLKVAETLVEMGTDSLCIKDMSGLLGPADAYDLVSTFKKRFGELPIDLHSHCTNDLGCWSYQWRVTQVFTNAWHFIHNVKEAIAHTHFVQLVLSIGQHTARNLVTTNSRDYITSWFQIEFFSDLLFYFTEVVN